MQESYTVCLCQCVNGWLTLVSILNKPVQYTHSLRKAGVGVGSRGTVEQCGPNGLLRCAPSRLSEQARRAPISLVKGWRALRVVVPVGSCERRGVHTILIGGTTQLDCVQSLIMAVPPLAFKQNLTSHLPLSALTCCNRRDTGPCNSTCCACRLRRKCFSIRWQLAPPSHAFLATCEDDAVCIVSS